MGLSEKLYDYQKECVELSLTNDKGIFCLPTGTGKTFVESAILTEDINSIDNKFGIYIINCPRIVLSYQLLKEVFTFLTSEHITARYMLLHSGGEGDQSDLDEIRENFSDDEFFVEYSQVPSSTKPSDVREMIDKAKRQDIPLIIVSTYHSVDKVNKALNDDEINMIINDESHYLAQNQFHDLVYTMKSKKTFFLTATMVRTHSDQGVGMNNVEKYGEVLKQMLPIEAIQKGKMLRPRLHYVLSDKIYTQDDLENSIGKVISESVAQHEYALQVLNPKLLIVVDGTKSMMKFSKSKEYDILRRKGYDIYMISSVIGNKINGENYRRTEFLKQLKKDGEDESKRMIILHFDILTEGIDISGLTGVELFRGLSKIKFLQTFGRVARLFKEDKLRINSGELRIDDLDSYNKPYGWLIIPGIIREDIDQRQEVEDLIGELRSYGFDPSEDIVVTNSKNGISLDNGIDAQNELNKRLGGLGTMIEKVNAEYESKELAKIQFDIDQKEIERRKNMTQLERLREDFG